MRKQFWTMAIGFFSLFTFSNSFAHDENSIYQKYYCSNVEGPLQPVVNQLNYFKFRVLVTPIVEKMTLDQKIGQMTLADLSLLLDSNNKIDPALIRKFNLGAVLASANETPNGQGGINDNAFGDFSVFKAATLTNWRKLAQGLSAQTVQVPLTAELKVNIPLLLGTDAVHGNQHVLGSVLFPHNIGLSATHDPQLFCAAGYFTAKDVLESGFNWIYAPTVAVSHNPQWGRTYEAMGSEPNFIKKYAQYFVAGSQMNDPWTGHIRGVLSTTKHFIGDGATYEGADEGNTKVNDDTRFFLNNFSGYYGAIKANTGSIMVSYSAINNTPMSLNAPWLKTLFLTQPAFHGFLVTDFGAIQKAANQGLPTTTEPDISYSEALAKSINGGLDMIMLSPFSPNENPISTFQATLKSLVTANKISLKRINEAVTRILAVKYAMGLIRLGAEQSWQTNARLSLIPSSLIYPVSNNIKPKHAAEVAQTAAEKSLVLLKNEPHSGGTHPVLPLKANQLKYVVLVGEKWVEVNQGDGTVILTLFQDFHNIGAQNGGWTIRWQGFNGNHFWQGEHKQQSQATSLLEGIKSYIPENNKLLFPRYQSMTDMFLIDIDRKQFLSQLNKINDMNANNTVIIAALAEQPSAEFMGDINISYCKNNPNNSTNGCLYNIHQNAYLPKQQGSTLEINLHPFSQHIVESVKNKDPNIPMVTILFSGRPMIVNKALQASQSFIAAWLPGTSGGQALANALFGSYRFCKGKHSVGTKQCLTGSPNTLPVEWLASMEGLSSYPVYNQGTGVPPLPDVLFPIGYGISD